MTIRNAIVTGASGAIGSAVADVLAGAGTHVYAVDVHADADDSISITRLTCDVTDDDALDQLVHDVRRVDGHLDCAISCAAVAGVPVGPDAHRRVHAVNVMGTVNLCEAVVPIMLAQGHGTVVNIGSLAGIIPAPGMAAYGASKAAVNFYTRALQHELRRSGVHVRLVCPPAVRTPLLDDLLAGTALTKRSLKVLRPISPACAAAAVVAATKGGPAIRLPGHYTRAAVLAHAFAPRATAGIVRLCWGKDRLQRL